MKQEQLDDLLDQLVSEYSDLVARSERPGHERFLRRVEASARPGLERCLKMIDAGLASTPKATLALVPGIRFGRYELIREIGRGGMAIVWLARDQELQRVAALKVLRPGLALEEQHVDRFRREALAIAKVQHQGIVQIFDVGSEHGHHYIAMEYIEGPSLARVIEALGEQHDWTSDALAKAAGNSKVARPRETFEQAAAHLMSSVANALDAAHANGLIHRDVKPSNILLRKNGTAVVADFGLAKGKDDPALSLTGEPLGTPYYMSPEQAWLSEIKVDHRTDVYSLGVTFFELLTGQRPFEGETVLEVFDAIKTSLIPGARAVEPRCSRDAACVIRRAMNRRPEDRYDSARALAEDLQAVAETRETIARHEEGGVFRRGWSHIRLMTSGVPQEYKSSTRFLGLPLFHIYSGPRMPGQPNRIARGWFAVGDVAIGGIALGRLSFGGVACGAIALGGLFSWGGLAGALFCAFGGLAVAPLAWGGVAAGYLAFGGIALGYGAIGGWSRGVYAMGGDAKGTHVLGDGPDGVTQEEWFEAVLPMFSKVFTE